MKENNKIKITKKELEEAIKQEYTSIIKENARIREIKSRLAEIDEELKSTDTLSEVEASGTKKVKSTGWTGSGEGDVKYGEKFEKIGSHLKEDDGLDDVIDLVGDEDEMETEEVGYFESKFAELGKELDEKMSNVEDKEDEELEIDMDEENKEDEENEEETEEVEVEEIEENTEDVEEVETDETLSEDLKEPIKGDTPAQDSEARFNDYMEKDKHVNEGIVNGAKILSEGFTPEKKTALSKELERMKALAKINK